MGLSKCFIAARSVGGLVSDLKETATQGEWSIFEPTSGWVRPRELEELCIRAASNVEDIALAVLIEDSDIAYLAAGTPEGIVARLLYALPLTITRMVSKLLNSSATTTPETMR